MGKQNDLNIRLNAQANIGNISKIKKDLTGLLNINLDKSIENNLSRALDKLGKIEKVFDEINKKGIYNDNDYKKFTQFTSLLETEIKNINSLVKDISTIDLVKGTKQYQEQIKGISTEIENLKKNFKDTTGLDFSKASQESENYKQKLKDITEQLKELESTGEKDKLNNILKERANLLNSEKQKLTELLNLYNEVNKYKNEETLKQSKGKYNNFEELQDFSSKKINKTNFLNERLYEEEIIEINKLKLQYEEYEKQLKSIDKLKTQTAKNGRIKKISEQLGIDANSTKEIQQYLNKLKEVINETAKLNVKNNNPLKTSIEESYNSLIKAKQEAKELMNNITLSANGIVKISNVTQAKTTSGLDKAIITQESAVKQLQTDDNSEAMLKAQQENTSAISALKNEFSQIESLLNTINNTQNSIRALNGQSQALAQKQASSLENVDSDTSQIASNTGESLNISANEKNLENVKKYNSNWLNNMRTEDGSYVPLNSKATSEIRDNVLSESVKNINNVLFKMNILKKDAQEYVNSLNEAENIELAKNISDAYSRLEILTQQTDNSLKIFTKTYEELDRALKNSKKKGESVIPGQLGIIDAAESNMISQELKKEALNTLNEDFFTIKNRENVKKDIQEYEKNTNAINNNKNSKQEKISVDRQEEQQINKNTKEYIENNKEIDEALTLRNNLINTTSQLSSTITQDSKNLKNISPLQRGFTDSFGKVTGYIGTYISLNYAINKIFSTIRSGMSTIKEMDDSITQIGVVTNQTTQTVWKSFNSYNSQAKRLKTTTVELLNATKLYYQQGLNTAEVNKMVEATAIAAALGETSMSNAADTLTAIMNSYSMAATDAMKVTDKISAVGADSAADFGELSSAIEKVASSAATAGVDLDHLMGYLGKMVEVTREAPTNIGTAMKTIVSRMAELKEDPTTALEDGTDVNKVQTALKTVGINLFDTNNEMRELDDVIDELGEKWNSLTRNSQAYIATIIAGNRQQSRFLALMNNYDRTMELVDSAVDSTGRSTQQFNNYSTGLESSLNEVRAQAEKFYSSITSGNSNLKILYDTFKNILEMINTLGPALTALGTTFAIVSSKMAKGAIENKKENVSRDLTSTIASNIENLASGGKAQGINIQSLLTGNGSNNNFINGLTQAFSGNKKEIIELNKLTELYNTNLLNSKDITKDLALSMFKQNGISKDLVSSIQAQMINTEGNIVVATKDIIAKQSQSIGTQILTAHTWAYTAAQAAATMGISLLIGVVANFLSKLSDLNKAKRENAQAAEQAAAQARSETDSLSTQLTKYNNLNKKISLTTEEKEELNSINNELMKNYPELIAGIDSEGNAYLKTGEQIEYYLKQKRIQAAEAEKEAARAKLNAGEVSKGKVATGNGTIMGLNANIKGEDTYGEESTSALTQVQSSIENFRQNNPKLATGNLLTRMAGLTLNGMGDIGTFLINFAFEKKDKLPINNMKQYSKDSAYMGLIQKYISGEQKFDESVYEYIKENYSDASNYEEGVEVLKNYEKYLKVSKNEMEKQYQTIIDSERSIAILNSGVKDEEEDIVEGFSKTLTSNRLAYENEKYGTDVEGYEEWLNNNSQSLSQGITNTMIKAVQGTNKDSVKSAYKKLVDAQKEGMPLEDIKKYKAELYGEIAKTSTLSEEEKENFKKNIVTSILQDQKDLDKIIDQAVASANIGNSSETKQLLTKTLSTSSSNVRQQILDGLSTLSKEEGYNEQIGQAYIKTISDILNPSTGDINFQKELENLDFTNQLDVNAFKQKWSQQLIEKLKASGIQDTNLAKSIVDMIIPSPGTVTSEVNKQLGDLLNTKGTVNNTNIKSSFSGQVSWQEAQENNLGPGEGNYNNDSFIISTEKAAKSQEEFNKKLKEKIDLLKLDARTNVSDGYKKIVDAQEEISKIEEKKNKGQYANNSLYENALEEQKKIIDSAQEQISLGNRQNSNAEKMTKELERQVKLTKTLKDNAEFYDYANEVNNTVGSLKDYASIYEKVQKNELSQLDILDLISNNYELLDSVYINERGQIALNAKSLEGLAESRIDEAYQQGNVAIAKLEMQKSMIDGEREYTEAELEFLKTMSTQWSNLSTDQQQALVNTANQMGANLTSTDQWATYVKKDINGAIRAWKEYFKSSKDEGGNEVNESGSGGSVNGGSVTNTGTTTKGADAIAKIDEQIQKIKKYQDLLGKYKTNGGKLYDDINNMGGGGSSSGGGSEDKFDAMLEKLDKFYNYMRQIEALDAKINKLREKRNLIDATKNYYIEDLKEENKLLEQQAGLYGRYIKDQTSYLAELRSAINSTYGDWAYFNNEGVVQVRQTEFNINSEAEQERYESFSELLQEYQDQYNTMLENQNKLYEIQSTVVENIKTQYDKILARVTDVTEELQRQADLLEHDITMSFSNIAKFDIMDEQLGAAVEGIKTAQSYINGFEKDIISLNEQIKNGPYSELLQYDQALGIWRTNEEKLNNTDIVSKYERMGYTWSEVETYVKSVAAKSEAIRNSWKETEDSLNSFLESLKQLIDDRISLIQDFFSSSTDEINKIFDTFDRKVTNIDNMGDLFGASSEQLEDKYLTLVTAVSILKQTIQQLKDNRGSILDTIKNEYPEYINIINGVAVVNKQAIEESTKLTEEQKAELLQLYGIYEASGEQIDGLEDKLIDYFNTMMEMEEAKRDAIIDLKQQVHDELMARDQEEIDDLRSKYDKMSQLDNEYYTELQQRVNDARNLRQDRQQQNNINQMQARLAVLQTSSDSSYNKELIDLQKQLNDALQTQADNDITRELERIAREQKEREEDRQMQLTAMENVLTFKDDNNWYWQEAERIWAEGPESVIGWLASSREMMNTSDENRALQFENLTTQMNTAFTTLQTAAGETARVSDGIVTQKSDEEQLKLDNINGSLGVVDTSVNAVKDKIDWTNAEAMKNAIQNTANITANANAIKDKMFEFYKTDVKPGTDGIINNIETFLGEGSKLLTYTDANGKKIDLLKDSNANGFIQNIKSATEAKNGIVNSIQQAKKEYLDTFKEYYKWLQDTYRKEHAGNAGSNGNGNVTQPSAGGSGNSGSSNAGGATGGAPSLSKGSTISVKPGTRWYYDSYGTSPSGIARGGKITYTNLKAPYAYNIEGLGWIRKQDIVGYSKGGYVDYTGVANVHGSQTEPEAFLNAKQTRLFEGLRDTLLRTSSNRTIDKTSTDEVAKEEYNIENVNINVKEIADTDAIDKVVNRVKAQIYTDSVGRNNMAIRRR